MDLAVHGNRRHRHAIAAHLGATLAAPPPPPSRLAAGPSRRRKEIKIAHIDSKTGPLEAYAKQTLTGLQMGLDYATGGTMTVTGRKIVVIEKDDQGKPDMGKTLLAAAYADDKVDIAVGPTVAGVALAMLPVAEEYKKILLVEPAVADSITGDKWNKYIFRTGRNSSQDAVANAAALDQAGESIATLAQDNAFGRDGVKAFKECDQEGQVRARGVPAAGTTDFTAGAAAHRRQAEGPAGPQDRLGGLGRRRDAVQQVRRTGAEKRYGIELATGGNILPAMVAYKQFPGMEGALYYYFGIPKNPVNEWLVANHYKQFKAPPDFFTAGGITAAIAVVEALKKTDGDTDTNKLITAMEGMSFDTPKGKMTFRKEDHQAMQEHVPLQDQGRPGVRLGRARAGARDQGRGDGRPDPQQALAHRTAAVLRSTASSQPSQSLPIRALAVPPAAR